MTCARLVERGAPAQWGRGSLRRLGIEEDALRQSERLSDPAAELGDGRVTLVSDLPDMTRVVAGRVSEVSNLNSARHQDRTEGMREQASGLLHRSLLQTDSSSRVESRFPGSRSA